VGTSPNFGESFLQNYCAGARSVPLTHRGPGSIKTRAPPFPIGGLKDCGALGEALVCRSKAYDELHGYMSSLRGLNHTSMRVYNRHTIAAKLCLLHHISNLYYTCLPKCSRMLNVNHYILWEAGGMLDLFAGSGGATVMDESFQWSVAMFRAKGAVEVIKRANDSSLRTYYPFKRNKSGDFIPLWRNYLFIEFKSQLTITICRSTSNFIKILCIPDEDGINQPVLVRKNVIDENMRLVQAGKFDDIEFRRKYYGIGSLVNIISGDFSGHKVRLLGDVPPDAPGNRKIPVVINGWKASIELWKLAL
jgi:hypothetical protein